MNNKQMHTQKEFGGPLGALGIIIFSHFLIYYLWISLQFFQGGLFVPTHFFYYISQYASPSWIGFTIYLGFCLLQFAFAVIMPGIWVKGLPVPAENNKQHRYLCNGIASWYATLLLIFVLHIAGIFKLSIIVDHLGSLITSAIIVSDLLAVSVYIYAVFKPNLNFKNLNFKTNPKPISNNSINNFSHSIIYNFFMGVILNPRVGTIDLKFFSEIRIAWILLFLLTLSAAVKQYELLGTITGPMLFMVIAHGLYTNACMKGEECIPTTWDIFHEKWGWMLIFWNFAGVPFVYSFQSFFILKNNPQLPTFFIVILFVILFIAYYIWDTSQSQKNRFRMQLRGTFIKRNTFPQLPWGTLRNPEFLRTQNGDALLIDGWWRYARKIHYMADLLMAITWALSCGFTGILPYFYPMFFCIMIIHRYNRDSFRCAQKYGEDWKLYCKKVPYRFIPFLY